MEIFCRRAAVDDIPAILKLQSANYRPNLPLEDRIQGFLSAEFTSTQIAAIADDLGVTVAVEAASIAGYLCAFRNEFEHSSAVLGAMLASYDRVHFEGRSINSYRSYIYGPVCIAREYRGRGVLRRLYDAQKKDLAGRYEIGVAFVSRSNPHSLQAHVAGLGMTDAGDFQVNGNLYAILAFSL